jgi:hypothetical protein
MEGYRISRDISYYRDDPTVYNYPDAYKTTAGDSLYLDLVYPANPSKPVPVLVTFSYSNSFATASNGKLTDANKHKRMYLPYFWGAFNDSFVEGASAVGFAWAVCDHPKYCDWGQGKFTGGGNKSLGAIEVNPDAARKEPWPLSRQVLPHPHSSSITRTIFMPTRTRTRRDSMPHKPS